MYDFNELNDVIDTAQLLQLGTKYQEKEMDR
jgi:hypothetical protein